MIVENSTFIKWLIILGNHCIIQLAIVYFILKTGGICHEKIN